jgi:hypothetical protein
MSVLSILLFMNVSAAAQESVPRFEVGGQFSLLSRNKPTPIFPSPTIVPDDFDHETKDTPQFTIQRRYRIQILNTFPGLA